MNSCANLNFKHFVIIMIKVYVKTTQIYDTVGCITLLCVMNLYRLKIQYISYKQHRMHYVDLSTLLIFYIISVFNRTLVLLSSRNQPLKNCLETAIY